MRLWRLTIPRRLLLVAAPLVSALLGAILVVILMKGVFGGEQHEQEAVAPTATATARAWPTVSPVPPSKAPPTRLLIPKIDVDAPLAFETVQADGFMSTPYDPELVAYYDLSAYHPEEEHRVGFGGNAIFSGHVDYIHYGPAVFWDLSKLKPGDEVEVRLEDGTVYHYAVVWNETWSVEDIRWDKIFEVNGRDAVTLITCAGSWDGHEYSDQRVVRAERAYGPYLDQSG